MADENKKGFDFAKKGFAGVFEVKVVETKPADLNGDSVVTFSVRGGGEYFHVGDLFIAKFDPIAEEAWER